MTDAARELGSALPAPHAWLRRVGWLVGLGLFAAAIWMAWRQRDTVGEALAAIGNANAIDVVLLLGGVAANIVLSAAMLRTLLLRYGQVGFLEMQAVVASATVLNAIPMKAGLFGRVAYHRIVNGIPITDTARTVVEGAVITVAVAAWLAIAAAVSIRFETSLWIAVLLPIPVLMIGMTRPALRRWLLAGGFRYVEVLVWAVRYHAAFALIGSPIAPTVALAFACVSIIATMIPFVSGGLGIREWAIGLLAPILADIPLELGVTADLVNREAGVLVIGGIGIPATVWLLGRMRRTAGDCAHGVRS